MLKLSAKPSLSIWQTDVKVLLHSDKVNITGWRNIKGKPDYFCDYITVAVKADNGWVFKCYEATTRAGLPYLLKPISRKGAAILVPGYYPSAFALGLHKGLPALKQYSALPIYRDNNKDSKFDEEYATIEKGFFGIDIHRAGIFSKLVGHWSAGCQVFQKLKDFEEFLSFCVKSGQTKFSYNLVEFTYGLQ